MISEEELIKHKWKYIPESHSWQKLGVTVATYGGHYHIKFKYDSPSHCYYSLYKSIYDTTMSELIDAIKYGINYILTHRSHNKALTPKYKRTLNNWLYVN